MGVLSSDTVANMREIWAEVDQPTRQVMRKELTSLVNELK